jgi:general L-amino acid transport system substrate-binding protein
MCQRPHNQKFFASFFQKRSPFFLEFSTVLRTTLFLACLLSATAQAETTLARVKASGQLRCGVVAQQSDFEWRDTHGDVAAFARDRCRALAASVLGNLSGLQILPAPDTPHGLQALHDGKLDVLYGVTPHADQAVHYGVAYGDPVFFDGQAIMVPAAAGVHTLNDLAGRQICFIGNTQNEAVLKAAFAARNIPFKPFPFQETGEMEAALVTGHCQAETADASTLAADRTGFHGRKHAFEIMPDRLTLDPFVPAVPANDSAWLRVVNAVQYALVRAEQANITQANVAPGDDRLTNATEAYALGLPAGWAAAAVRAAGNSGEIFDRDLGALGLPRGVNAPWDRGGLFWAPPLD